MKIEAWVQRSDGASSSVIDEASEKNIALVVGAIVDAGDGYVILREDDETYVQATTKGPVADGLIVERRDGCAGEHYRTDRRLTTDELSTLLVNYLRGASNWSHAISWHQMVADPEIRPSA
jgi:hypothetical protein